MVPVLSVKSKVKSFLGGLEMYFAAANGIASSALLRACVQDNNVTTCVLTPVRTYTAKYDLSV